MGFYLTPPLIKQLCNLNNRLFYFVDDSFISTTYLFHPRKIHFYKFHSNPTKSDTLFVCLYVEISDSFMSPVYVLT